jgi:hypothetical protein
LAAGQLKGRRDAHDLAHAIERLTIAVIEVAMHTHSAQDGVRFARRAVYIKTAGDEAIDHLLNLRVARAFLHYDDHW